MRLHHRWLLVVLSVGAVGLALRLYLAVAFYGNFDQESYDIVAAIVRRGGNVYAETRRYNYSPVWSWCLLAFSHLAALLGLPLHTVVRSFLTLVDGLNAILLWRAVSGRVALLYWLHPFAVYIVGYHGQFETLASLPILVAAFLLLRRPRTWSILLLGLAALLIKQITLFLVWTVFLYAVPFRRATVWMLLIVSVFMLSFRPYLPEGIHNIVHRVFLYRGSGVPYSPFIRLPGYLYTPLFLLVMGAAPVLARYRWRLPLARALHLSALLFLLFPQTIGAQYFLLGILFGSPFVSLGYVAFSLVLCSTVVLAVTREVYLYRMAWPLVLYQLAAFHRSRLLWHARTRQGSALTPTPTIPPR